MDLATAAGGCCQGRSSERLHSLLGTATLEKGRFMKHQCAVGVAPSTTNLRYRPFTPADIPAAHGLSMALGWPYRPEDWQFSAETAIGFVAEERGIVVGTAMCWKFGSNRASLGHVIVSSEQQGRGIGRKLMEAVLEELGHRVTFLHATPAGRPLYEKLGFVECGSLEQYQGNVCKAVPLVLLDGERLRLGTAAGFPSLIELATRYRARAPCACVCIARARAERGTRMRRRDRWVFGAAPLRPGLCVRPRGRAAWARRRTRTRADRPLVDGAGRRVRSHRRPIGNRFDAMVDRAGIEASRCLLENGSQRAGRCIWRCTRCGLAAIWADQPGDVVGLGARGARCWVSVGRS